MKAIVEIPKFSFYKYEIKDEKLIIDRELKNCFENNYGYIPDTLWYDGDPIDVFILNPAPMFPGAQVEIRLIGVIECIDNGKKDDKLIGIIDRSYTKKELDTLRIEIPYIYKFLNNYKKGFVAKKILNSKKANEYYKKSVKIYERTNKRTSIK